MKHFLLLSFFYLIFLSHLNAQEEKKHHTENRWEERWWTKINAIPVIITVNKNQGDSTFLFKHQGHFYHKKVSKSGSLIEEGRKEGHHGHVCGNDPIKNGNWITYYPTTGIIKSIGNYRCGKKINQWLYFHENGNLKKSETYTLPYPIWTKGNTNYYLNGSYKEYYKNGQLKTSGNYKIVEASVKYDVEFDSITFEGIKKQCCQWEIRSIKTGEWKSFDKSGQLVHTKKESPKFEIRDLETSLKTSQQVLQQLNKKHKFRQ
jgi:antitoxin component YwqK of YwqJK toxin-antitoxin module